MIDARRNFAGVCGRWCLVVFELHRFFIAISRAVVDHNGGGGTAPHPLVWSALPKRRRSVHAVRDRAFLPGSSSGLLYLLHVAAGDVEVWPYSGLLVKWVSFLGSLHWPATRADLAVGGVSFVEMPISVSAVQFSPGIDIWRSCRIIGAFQVALCFVWWYWKVYAMLYWC